MVEPTCELIKELRSKGLMVSYLRLDNAGENNLLEARCKSSDWQFNITFEYMAKDTPQHNHMAELGFAALGNKGRALMIWANVPFKYRFHLYREAFKTATDLDGLALMKVKGKIATRYEHMFGINPAWVKHLNTFGEAGTVEVKGKYTSKLSDCGAQCMMVGYAEQHDGDVYRMWNPLTGKIHVTGEAIWLKQMLFKRKVDEEAAEPGAELGVEINSVESNHDNDHEEIEQKTEDTEDTEDAEKKTHDEIWAVTLVDLILKVWRLKEVVMKMKMKRMMIKVVQPPQDQVGGPDHLLTFELKWLLQQ